MADFVVLEVGEGRNVRIGLWHVKPAGGAPSVRVGDLQVVVAQAIKSRRWLTDYELWSELKMRLLGQTQPKLVVMDGDEVHLRALLGVEHDDDVRPLDHANQLIRGEVVIVQPGLSWSQLRRELTEHDPSAQQVRDLLAVFDDAVGQLGHTVLLCSS